MGDSSPTSERDRKLQELLASYLDAEAAGRTPETEAWVEAHPEFAAELRQFLADHQRMEQVGRPLREAAPELAVTVTQSADRKVGTIISGRYKLLEQIGEGGMGTVWVADQIEPIRRRVALKLIKPGMDSRHVLLRFEAERQALALMDHPNIAKVLDGGIAEDGRPFFAMEYVRGVPITQFCDDGRLTVRQRLELFVRVCQAVQHAHQKGIIHRDLKPSNILVCLYDGHPVPKVIDFGLAKAVSQPLTEHTLYTAHGLMVGTPLYMSPEQAEFNNLDVDTRADIYSLGVVLYELLTGVTPIEKQQLKNAAGLEILRLIREEEPPKPSTRLSRMGSTQTTAGPQPPATTSFASVAAQRSVEPAQLSRILRGDLDWIVMKALEKDRGRRYDTATSLARDIERHFREEPVEACPPTAAYRLRKFARKHRAAILTATGFALLLLFGIAASTYQAIRATKAEHDARQQTKIAMDARDLEKRARDEAEDSKQEAFRSRELEARARDVAEAERDEKQQALVKAEGLRIAAESTAARYSDPGLALLLAIEGVRRVPNHLTYSALYDALQASHERRVISDPMQDVQFVRYAAGGQIILAAGRLSLPNGRWLNGAACVFDTATGKPLATWRGLNCELGDLDLAPDGQRVAAVIQGATSTPIEPGKPGLAVFTDRVAYLWDTATGKDLLQLRRHDERIVSVRFSPDGQKLLTASWDTTARIWDATSGRELQVLKGHECSLAQAVFSPDGALALTLSLQGTNVSTYAQPQTAEQANGLEIRVDPDLSSAQGEHESGSSSTHSASFTGESYFGRLWNVATGKLTVELSKNRPSAFTFGKVWHPTSASFSPDGESLAVAFEENTAAIWDVETGGAEKILLTGHEGPVRAIAFHPRSRKIATASHDRTARLWDATSGKELLRLRGHQDAVLSAKFSDDGQELLTTSSDRTARIWSTQSGEEMVVLQGHRNAVRSAEFHPTASQVVTGGDSTVRIWDYSPPLELGVVLKGHIGPLTALEFSPDSQRLLTAAGGQGTEEDETPRVWDVASGKQVLALGKNKLLGNIRDARFLSGGTQVLTISTVTEGRLGNALVNTSAVHVWDARTGAEALSVEKHGNGAFTAVGSPDSKWIATVSDGYTRSRGRGLLSTDIGSGGTHEAGLVRVWNAADGQLVATLATRIAETHRPQFSPDARRVLVIAQSGPARVHDARTGRELFSLNSPDPTFSAAYAPDGKTIATGSSQSIQVWNADDGKGLGTIGSLPGPLTVIEFSTDSRRLVAIAGPAAVICDPAARRAVTTLKSHEGPIRDVAFSRDGAFCVTGSDDRTAVLWDVETGRMLALYKGHTEPVLHVAISADGKFVATASADATARIWPRDLWPAVLDRRTREFTPHERVRYGLESR